MAAVEEKPKTGEIAIAYGHKDITWGYLSDDQIIPLEQALPLYGEGTWFEAADKIAEDYQVQTCLSALQQAVTRAEWEILPGGTSRQDKKAADWLRELVGGVPWDRITEHAIQAVHYGYAIAETILMPDGNTVTLDDTREGIRFRDIRRFRFDAAGRLRLLTLANSWNGEGMPTNNFWHVRFGGTHADQFYGHGKVLYSQWPAKFKRGGLRAWLLYLDKFAWPTTIVEDPGGLGPEEKAKLDAIARNLGEMSGVKIPSGVVLRLLEATRSGSADYTSVINLMDAAIAKLYLGQTMTSDDGSSLSQAKVHFDVRQDIVAATADLVNESANRQWIKRLTEWNFPGAALPKIWRKIEQPEDQNTRVNRDKTLFDMGIFLTDDAIADVYGEGYERRAGEPKPQDPLAELQFEEFIEFLESELEPIEFAANKCTKGWSCKSTCITKAKKCRSPLNGQTSHSYADWLATQATTTEVVSGTESEGQAKKPETPELSPEVQARIASIEKVRDSELLRPTADVAAIERDASEQIERAKAGDPTIGGSYSRLLTPEEQDKLPEKNARTIRASSKVDGVRVGNKDLEIVYHASQISLYYLLAQRTSEGYVTQINPQAYNHILERGSGKVYSVSWGYKDGDNLDFQEFEGSDRDKIRIARTAQKVWEDKVLPKLKEGDIVANAPIGRAGGGRDRIYQKAGFSKVHKNDFQYAIMENGKLRPLQLGELSEDYGKPSLRQRRRQRQRLSVDIQAFMASLDDS